MTDLKVYFHRGSIIFGKRGKWRIDNDRDPMKAYKTLDEVKNAA